jgi:hypothetical protein
MSKLRKNKTCVKEAACGSKKEEFHIDKANTDLTYIWASMLGSIRSNVPK